MYVDLLIILDKNNAFTFSHFIQETVVRMSSKRHFRITDRSRVRGSNILHTGWLE